MHIHFVCLGNGYRSRIAEAYCKSKLINKKITVSSSGIEANSYKISNGPICWEAMRLIENNNLIPFMAWKENQTTKNILKKVDLLICMRQSHLDYCINRLGYINKPTEVWEIPDIDDMKGFIPSTKRGIKTDINHIKLTDKIYRLITQKVDGLLTRVNKQS